MLTQRPLQEADVTTDKKGSIIQLDGARSLGELSENFLPGDIETFDARKGLPAHIVARINEEFAAEAEQLNRAGHVGYMARGMVNASMPYKNPKAEVFKRVSGDYTLRIVGGEEGIPFGVYPRLLMLWLTTEVVRTKTRDVLLGESLSEFLRNALGVDRITGGTRGTGTLVADQMKRLFGSMVSMKYAPKTGGSRKPYAINNVLVAEQLHLADESGDYLWVPQTEESKGWRSNVRLSQPFFEELRDGPVPIDVVSYKTLRDSPLAMDIYSWMGYRMSYVDGPLTVSWERLMLQFGSSYPNTQQGIRNFRKNFRSALSLVHGVYPEARFDTNTTGLVLKPSPTPISKSRVAMQGSLPLDFSKPQR